MITDSFGSGWGQAAGEHASLDETHRGRRAAGDQFYSTSAYLGGWKWAIHLLPGDSLRVGHQAVVTVEARCGQPGLRVARPWLLLGEATRQSLKSLGPLWTPSPFAYQHLHTDHSDSGLPL